jgi:hypothetical protein
MMIIMRRPLMALLASVTAACATDIEVVDGQDGGGDTGGSTANGGSGPGDLPTRPLTVDIDVDVDEPATGVHVVIGNPDGSMREHAFFEGRAVEAFDVPEHALITFVHEERSARGAERRMRTVRIEPGVGAVRIVTRPYPKETRPAPPLTVEIEVPPIPGAVWYEAALSCGGLAFGESPTLEIDRYACPNTHPLEALIIAYGAGNEAIAYDVLEVEPLALRDEITVLPEMDENDFANVELEIEGGDDVAHLEGRVWWTSPRETLSAQLAGDFTMEGPFPFASFGTQVFAEGGGSMGARVDAELTATSHCRGAFASYEGDIRSSVTWSIEALKEPVLAGAGAPPSAFLLEDGDLGDAVVLALSYGASDQTWQYIASATSEVMPVFPEMPAELADLAHPDPSALAFKSAAHIDSTSAAGFAAYIEADGEGEIASGRVARACE